MQKVKDGYRASFRLNEDNPEHMEIYQMFQELMNTGKYRNESDLYRVAQFYIKNHHEAIVSEEEWNMAQEIRKSSGQEYKYYRRNKGKAIT